MASKTNMDVRLFLQRNGVSQKDIAEFLRVTPACVCVWFREEMTIPKKAQIYDVVMKIYEQKYGNRLIS